jgi:beta-barrel assembly-enhancing protease
VSLKTGLLIVVVSLLLAGTTLATLGAHDGGVSLSSLRELWSDSLRDADQVGMRATRISESEEMRLGKQLAATVGNVRPQDDRDSVYVSAVGRLLLSNLRRPGIAYQFYIVESPQINAFALPGGQIFVTSGMLGFVESEAELAAVLGHEISHVDLRHCVERYQYEASFRKAGIPEAGWMVEMAHRLATAGFSQDQELEADAHGERLIVEAQYDPSAGPTLFARMGARMGEPHRPPADTPSGELTGAVGGALTAYFRTHPPSEERSRRLQAMLDQYRHTLAGRQFYAGRESLRQRTAGSRQEYPLEWKAL